ncbi:hypothetical protein [Novosphingobium sp. JCM 18896]|uniref:hypothetical protein n=1 Tax=Novosphingobium sp. JCM 18896 TaxID=2989731 RepID=UPI0022218F7F|nr:hypothetical protein [Novosphingobium sp. JCM 18896]MCW1430897.1 hypothetical protein [Novosphingobium sp. JCM 18896]
MSSRAGRPGALIVVLAIAKAYFEEAIREWSRLESMMSSVATIVLAMVNAPYGADLCAHQLATMLTDPESATGFSASVFAFFSEIPPALQMDFIEEMELDAAQATKVANRIAEVSGYALPLAA